MDNNGNKQPVDFVNTGNNHHVAIYVDEAGNYQENIVSFFEATARAINKQPIIDHEYNSEKGWRFCFSMKQNEYFVFPDEENGFNPEDIDLTKELDKTAARKIKKIISPEPDPEPQTEDLEQPDEPQTEEEPETEQPETREQPTRKTIILNPVILIAGLGLAAALGVIFFITRKARTTPAQLEEPQEE